jgi:hypothetical protein
LVEANLVGLAVNVPLVIVVLLAVYAAAVRRVRKWVLV